MSKIPSHTICAIMAQYPLCPLLICDAQPPTQDKMEGVDFIHNKIIAERVSWEPEQIRLLVKPLEKISDEDALVVAEYWYTEVPKTDKHKEIAINAVKKDLKNTEIMLPFEAGQYLLSKHYALPYQNYTVQQLVDAGVYQLL